MAQLKSISEFGPHMAKMLAKVNGPIRSRIELKKIVFDGLRSDDLDTKIHGSVISRFIRDWSRSAIWISKLDPDEELLSLMCKCIEYIDERKNSLKIEEKWPNDGEKEIEFLLEYINAKFVRRRSEKEWKKFHNVVDSLRKASPIYLSFSIPFNERSQDYYEDLLYAYIENIEGDYKEYEITKARRAIASDSLAGFIKRLLKIEHGLPCDINEKARNSSLFLQVIEPNMLSNQNNTGLSEFKQYLNLKATKENGRVRFLITAHATENSFQVALRKLSPLWYSYISDAKYQIHDNGHPRDLLQAVVDAYGNIWLRALEEAITGPKVIKTFISYTRSDNEDFQKVRAIYRGLTEKLGTEDIQLGEWTDLELVPGVRYTREILMQLETSNLIIFLVSEKSLESDFIKENELAPALEREKRGECRIIPVVLSEVDEEILKDKFGDIERIPVHDQIHAFKPVHDKSWASEEEAWRAVDSQLERGIRKYAIH